MEKEAVREKLITEHINVEIAKKTKNPKVQEIAEQRLKEVQELYNHLLEKEKGREKHDKH